VRNFSDHEQTNPQVSALKERIKAKSWPKAGHTGMITMRLRSHRPIR